LDLNRTDVEGRLHRAERDFSATIGSDDPPAAVTGVARLRWSLAILNSRRRFGADCSDGFRRSREGGGEAATAFVRRWLKTGPGR